MKHFAKCLFQFVVGGYLCSVYGKQSLIDLIPSHWSNFNQKNLLSNRRIIIRLEENALESECDLNDGWESSISGNLLSTKYFKNGKAIFSLQPVSENELVVCVRRELDSYVRIGIHYGILCLLYRECVGLHGVTLLCSDEIVVLSAPSGTGKTTLAQLLEKYCEAIVINGDFALLRPTESEVIFEPSPFCGTSGRCLNYRVKVNRLVFLGQSSDNRWHAMNGMEAVTQFMSNAFIPSWDHRMLVAIQENILKCISRIGVYSYSFAPEKYAAEVFYRNLINDNQQY